FLLALCRGRAMATGSWALVEELFARGDGAFAEELRRVHDPEPLGHFAATWIADPRPFARQALFDYLSRPLNCYRHEALVKRLFKLAEKNEDDELMGAFLVALDRSIRRVRKNLTRRRYEVFRDQAAADAAVRQWAAEGFSGTTARSRGTQVYAYATKTE